MRYLVKASSFRWSRGWCNGVYASRHPRSPPRFRAPPPTDTRSTQPPLAPNPGPVASDEQSAERFQYGREHSQPWRRAPSERRRGPENSGQSTAHRSTRILVEAARYGLRGRASPGRSCSRSRLSSRRRPRPARCTRQQFGRTDAAGRPPLPPLRSGRYARPAVPSLRSARYTSKTLYRFLPRGGRAGVAGPTLGWHRY